MLKYNEDDTLLSYFHILDNPLSTIILNHKKKIFIEDVGDFFFSLVMNDVINLIRISVSF